MGKRLYAALGAAALGAGLLSGCGTVQTIAVPWLHTDTAAKTVALTLNAGYNSANGYANFNGYANGQMTIQVPLGYRVLVTYNNVGGIPFGFGVYNQFQQLAFNGAGDSVSSMLANAGAGVLPGQHAKWQFTASKTGSYRIENLLDRIDQQTRPENFGMWVRFDVVRGGAPKVTVSN
ncbi:MAG: sulfocyanin-like copper-binding protein [Sulfobacillus sp.]